MRRPLLIVARILLVVGLAVLSALAVDIILYLADTGRLP